jgi:hypothetical protein
MLSGVGLNNGVPDMSESIEGSEIVPIRLFRVDRVAYLGQSSCTLDCRGQSASIHCIKASYRLQWCPSLAGRFISVMPRYHKAFLIAAALLSSVLGMLLAVLLISCRSDSYAQPIPMTGSTCNMFCSRPNYPPQSHPLQTHKTLLLQEQDLPQKEGRGVNTCFS